MSKQKFTFRDCEFPDRTTDKGSLKGHVELHIDMSMLALMLGALAAENKRRTSTLCHGVIVAKFFEEQK